MPQVYEDALQHAEGAYDGTIPLQVYEGTLTLHLDPDGAEDSDGGPRVDVSHLGDLLALACSALDAYSRGAALAMARGPLDRLSHGDADVTVLQQRLASSAVQAHAVLELAADRLA